MWCFPEIMTVLLKIIHRPCCEMFYVVKKVVPVSKKVVPTRNCTQQGLWIYLCNSVMISVKSTTFRAPFSPIILERRQKSLWPTSPELDKSQQNNLSVYEKKNIIPQCYLSGCIPRATDTEEKSPAICSFLRITV